MNHIIPCVVVRKRTIVLVCSRTMVCVRFFKKLFCVYIVQQLLRSWYDIMSVLVSHYGAFDDSS